MTSTPAAPTPSATHRQPRMGAAEEADLRGAGLVEFAGILMATFGIFNILNGIAAIARSDVYARNADYVFGNLRAWGWVVLAFGILQLVAVGALGKGRPWARWFAITVLAVNALVHLLFLPSFPVWSVLVVAADVVALYGLSAYGGARLFVGMVEPGPQSHRGARPPV
jgi:hypothetical protein